MTISSTLLQVRQLDPELADQLSAQIRNLAHGALCDFEGLLTEHLDLNIFNVSKHLVGSIESLARLCADLGNQSVEEVLLEVRHGDSWGTEVLDCVPDWADATEFPHVVKNEDC